MKIRFQADADLRVPIVKGLKRREPRLILGRLTRLVQQGWMMTRFWRWRLRMAGYIVSHDVTTMPETFSRFIQEHVSPGVILISQELSYRKAIEGLLRVWFGTEAEEWENVLSFLPR